MDDYFIVTEVLDLHGFFPEQVPEIVDEFIKNALELKLYRLRIIHGKGKSKLKWVVLNELKENPHVESYQDAPPEIGGWGATIVHLKQPAQAKE
ncbi:DNA mismatch repair protein MutS [candidate division KSB1 bacterium]|nr:DNA mismatch repair protein MutS [candidate division KSB1 bacterium]